jgi:hypothetical protein
MMTRRRSPCRLRWAGIGRPDTLPCLHQALVSVTDGDSPRFTRRALAADLRGRCFEPLISDSGTDRTVLCACPWLAVHSRRCGRVSVTIWLLPVEHRPSGRFNAGSSFGRSEGGRHPGVVDADTGCIPGGDCSLVRRTITAHPEHGLAGGGLLLHQLIVCIAAACSTGFSRRTAAIRPDADCLV